ncbi:RNA processing-related mitochondrial RNA degradation [Rhodotorula toruloides]|uniref:RNA processing-related mitochondrial RNA degradation n=1 Tax=Rhodotorula toruloides TaxID=5286 RepID=A0A511KEH3_RHOTO|nr:RNA processing-related mitochondrial RNA degradation [Rhodotorula toruloides]
MVGPTPDQRFTFAARRFLSQTKNEVPSKELKLLRGRISALQARLRPWDSMTAGQKNEEVERYRSVLRLNGLFHSASPSKTGNAPSCSAPEATPAPSEPVTRSRTSSDVPAHLADGTQPSPRHTPAQPAPIDRNADRERLMSELEAQWPRDMQDMEQAIRIYGSRIVQIEASNGNASRVIDPNAPKPRDRNGPFLLDKIAQSLAVGGDSAMGDAVKEEKDLMKEKWWKPNLATTKLAGLLPQTRKTGPRRQKSKSEAKAGDGSDPTLNQSEEPPVEAIDISTYKHVLTPGNVSFDSIPPPGGPVPVATLAHSLDRVLFNPGVHFLQDPRSGVYNFTRDTLENVPPIEKFDFSKLPQYITSSKDEALQGLAKKEDRKFVGSTSSTTGMLCQIYFWLSKFKPVNLNMLSQGFEDSDSGFSFGQKLPASVVLNYSDGRYAIDADKSIDKTADLNILRDYGHLMEKLLTTEASEFKRFLVGAEDPAPSEADARQAYHYAKTKEMVLRSQLDACNQYLPNKTFDLKTRSTVAVRQDRLNWEAAAGYIIDRLRGAYESFEREYYDLIRSAFLKYQFQARIGGMDGIFVAYHSTERFFGFQYVPIAEMDEALFGSPEAGDQVFRLSLGALEHILTEATKCYPDETINLTFAAQEDSDVLRVFVAPQREMARVNEGETRAEEAGLEGDDKKQVLAGLVERIDMTLLELKGSNYLDGVFQEGPVSVERRSKGKNAFSEFLNRDAEVPIWQVGYNVESSNTKAGGATPAGAIAAFFADTRSLQRIFSSVILPAGITPADVAAAAERAREAGVELDESDLAARFPLGDGISYRGPTKYVENLRKLAREGLERRLAGEEKREADRGGAQEKIVEVQSKIVVREA